MATQIGTLGNISVLTVGGRVFTDLTSLIILYGEVSTATRYTTLRKQNGAAGYQVTAGKTLTISAMSLLYGGTVTNTTAVALLYGDTDVGINSAAAPTTPKYIGSDVNMFVFFSALGAGATPSGPSSTLSGIDFGIPAAKYPCMQTNSTTNFGNAFYGYEA